MKKLLFMISVIIVLRLMGCSSPMLNVYTFDSAALARVTGLSPNAARGEIFFTPIPNEGLRIKGQIEGLIPRHSYAVFIYERGECHDEKSMGAIFDPGRSGLHGLPGLSPGQHNAGDLPNITADEDGIAEIDYTTDALGIGHSSFSVIGKSLVLHAGPSDFTTQPTGGSGDIIACGVIRICETQK